MEPQNPHSWENAVIGQGPSGEGSISDQNKHKTSRRSWLEDEPLKRSGYNIRAQPQQIYASLGALLTDVLSSKGIEEICRNKALSHILALRRHLSEKLNLADVDPYSRQNLVC